MAHCTYLALLLVVAVTTRVCNASMVVSVAYGKKECYRIRVPDKTPSIISGNFDLLDDEVDGSFITAWITKIAGYRGVGRTVWHSEEEEHEEDFSINVDPVGVYELCFELQTDPNNDEYAEAYAVGFNLRLDPAEERALDETEQGPDTKKAMEIIDSARQVETTWHNLVDHYIYLRNREALAVELSQKIQDRVMGWTVFEAALVIVMAVGQVLYWKKFFETRRYL
uniref:GOLD domain-containing protein n=1 Tax=Amphora coffeiformis TaxID=265554 RepID=A0A7S3L531_9STRA|eukprot:scaffold6164_cov163-Amphora_coffeaeformis.AAC.3